MFYDTCQNELRMKGDGHPPNILRQYMIWCLWHDLLSLTVWHPTRQEAVQGMQRLSGRWMGHENRDVQFYCFRGFVSDSCKHVCHVKICQVVLSVRDCITPNDVGPLHTFLRVQDTPARKPKMNADVHWFMNYGITGQANLHRLDDVLQVLGSGLGFLCGQKDLEY